MPRSKKTTASATVTRSAIDHATSTLEELPEKPKENWSLREAVAHLQVHISSALSKGYSYEEVAKMLTEKGIEISASSLKSYLSAAKRQKETAPKTGRTGRRSRKALGENLMVVESAPSQSSNGTAAKVSESLNGAKQEPIASESADSPTPTKRRTRSSTKSATSSKQKSPASKTAAKSKSAPRTQSASGGTKGTRGKRQRQA
jgi:hypothetical protein